MSFNSNLLFGLHKTLLNNIFARLKSINIVLIKFRVLYNLNLEDSISSDEKLRIAVNLRFEDLDCLIKLDSFYQLKTSGFSYNIPFIRFSNASLNCLYNIFCLPFVEATADKFAFGFRPYRDSSDLFFSIKKIFSKNRAFSFCFKTKLKFIFPLKILPSFWLLKNFPLNRRILLSWLKTNHSKKIRLEDSFCFFDETDIYSTFCNFVFNGLL